MSALQILSEWKLSDEVSKGLPSQREILVSKMTKHKEVVVKGHNIYRASICQTVCKGEYET